MKKVLTSHHPKRHIKSFKYAVNGLFYAMLNEANFRVQMIVTAIAFILGLYFNISNMEWALIVVSSSFLLSAEMLNTVVEEFMDHLMPEQNDIVKVIKDLSAGFVLTSAVSMGAVLMLIFANRLSTLL